MAPSSQDQEPPGNPARFNAQAIAAVVRVTSGNFRLLQRLFAQVERVMRINELSALTEDVIEAARSTLVIGAA